MTTHPTGWSGGGRGARHSPEQINLTVNNYAASPFSPAFRGAGHLQQRSQSPAGSRAFLFLKGDHPLATNLTFLSERSDTVNGKSGTKRGKMRSESPSRCMAIDPIEVQRWDSRTAASNYQPDTSPGSGLTT